jgi:hypothetical protein
VFFESFFASCFVKYFCEFEKAYWDGVRTILENIVIKYAPNKTGFIPKV